MVAFLVCTVSGAPQYKVVDGAREYWMFRGDYSTIAKRRIDGCPSHVSINGPRHAALRARIDAAIAVIA
ncbi:hypothetical protein [Burkholderia sp. BC1]|uniref:hypothetical protein n=1 Tax=Burkholderia sp. BC1 TaxID=1095370 RepID=UPI004044E576